MALRVIEVHVPEDRVEQTRGALLDAGAHDTWSVPSPGPDLPATVRGVIGASSTGPALDLLYERVGGAESFRALVHPLDATLPRPPAGRSDHRAERIRSAAGVSREEVYAAIDSGAQLTTSYMALTVLAATVAAIGLTHDNTAAVIGAMVVAPLLGPNMGVALGLTLGDGRLTREAVRSGAVGLGLAYATALVLAIALSASPELPEIASRTRLTLWDMVLALAAGAAGTLAFTTGAPAFLVGVMVAVALLPPTVASGLLLGEGYLPEAGAAFLLMVANATAVLLAAMATFLAKGMRPRHWWEAGHARASAGRGLLGAAALMVILAAAVVLSRSFLPVAG